jgi:hypothetical protein
MDTATFLTNKNGIYPVSKSFGISISYEAGPPMNVTRKFALSEEKSLWNFRDEPSSRPEP